MTWSLTQKGRRSHVALRKSVGVVTAVVLVAGFLLWPEPYNAVVQLSVRSWRPAPWDAPPSVNSLLGCYAMVIEGWTPAEVRQRRYLDVPAVVQLTSTPEKHWHPGSFRVTPSLVSGAFWFVTPARTLDLVWTNGHNGLHVELGPAGQRLAGRVRTFWDYNEVIQWARVTATPMPCVQ